MSDTIDSSHRRLELQALARDGHDDAASNGTGQTHADIGPALGSNLRRLRMRRGLSLERLSKQARVSRAMLSQIELGRSAPSVNIVWRIASALSVPWSALLSAHPDHAPRVLHAHKSQVIGNYDGSFSSRALFQREPRRGAEFYQLSIKPQGVGASPAYAPQSSANIALSEGSVRIKLGASILRLHAGDAAVFDADVEQIYENTGDTTAVLYLVISYACSDEG
ncbi:MAG TPA: helix-turn-helix domain-containing protein [Polyangiales bacterium]|nr:helix-turn-helix domain-containing protein [Polyangiales bacterium]